MRSQHRTTATPPGHVHTALAAITAHAIDRNLPAIKALTVHDDVVVIDVPGHDYEAWADSINVTVPEHTAAVEHGPLLQIMGGPTTYAEVEGRLPDLGIRVRVTALVLDQPTRPALMAVRS